MPAYAVVPNSLGRLQEYKVQLRRPGETAGWLGRAFDPLTTRIEKRDAGDNPYWRACNDEELTFQIDGLVTHDSLNLNRMSKRQSLLTQFDDARRRLADKTVDTYSRHQQRALALVTSEEARKALDITAETPGVRDQYGRHLFGQSTLMARRLVEAGSRFVTVHYDCVDGYSWDSHRNSDDVKKHLLPTMDQALSALLLDLEQRGLMDETLVVCLGEMDVHRRPTPSGVVITGAHCSRLYWRALVFVAAQSTARRRRCSICNNPARQSGRFGRDHLPRPGH